MVTQNLDIIR